MKTKTKNIRIHLLSVMALCAALFLSGCVGQYFENVGKAFKGHFMDYEYDSVPERWRNEWVSDSRAASEVIKALLSSADSGDREAFSENFTPELQASTDFAETLDAFFESYPVGLSECELDGGGVSSEMSTNDGHAKQDGWTHYDCTLNGERYFINLSFCHGNDLEPDKVGVTYFTVRNLEAKAVYNDNSSRDRDYEEGTYMLCDIQSSDDICARLIKGNAFLWTPTDTPKLTGEEMGALLDKYGKRPPKELWDIIGEPNAQIKWYNCTGYDIYYELQPEDGEPRYAYICVDGKYRFEIYSAYLCSHEKFFTGWKSDN
ncbi:MAG: DUF5104 domain-containing protein [Ruminiclostridium sp.]|nr:DUF5104 domain-containing protein [Ruminiclostridium sp.]